MSCQSLQCSPLQDADKEELQLWCCSRTSIGLVPCLWQITDTQHTHAVRQLFLSCMCMLWTFTFLSEAALLSSASFFAFSASFLAAYNETYCKLHLKIPMNSIPSCRTAELDVSITSTLISCIKIWYASFVMCLSLIYASNLLSNSSERQCGTFATCWARLAHGACVLVQYLQPTCHAVHYLSAD